MSRTSIAALATIPLLAASLAACSSSSEDGETVEVRAGHVYAEEHPVHRCGFQEIAKAFDDNPDVGLKLSVAPASQLGSWAEMFEAGQSGSLDLVGESGSGLSTYVEPLGVFDTAYAFEGADGLEAAADGDVAKPLWDELADQTGMRQIGTWYNGVRHVTANKPITKPADMSGMQFRVPPGPAFEESLKGMGASPTSIDFSELYLALSQGVVDGQENPLPTINDGKLVEVQSHLSLTGHIVQGLFIFGNEKFLDTLTDEQRELVESAVADASASVRECIEESEQQLLDDWKDAGAIEIVEGVDRAAFQTAVSKHISSALSAEWFETYQKMTGGE